LSAGGDEAREREGANGEQARACIHLAGATKWVIVAPPFDGS
jgi:hypothetical protein